MKPGSRTLLARMESAGPGVARALEIGVGERVVHWQRLRLADQVPDVRGGRLPRGDAWCPG